MLLLTTALHAVPLLAQAQPAPGAAPQGGQVVAGQASIAQTAARTTVNQSSQRAAVDWKRFDVGSAHTVQFAQPGASAVTLNRVTGPNPSEIAGRIQANGQVVIVNQAGVMFHQGAQIDTAGLVATASGISNGNFMAGRMVFDQPAKPGARVENRGSITIRDRGLAALVAPQVANSGVIQARMGTVILGGAETHRLDLYGDGMVGINVTGQVRAAPDGTKALVTNTGTIAASGGTVVLTAEAVDGVVQTLVNAGGHVGADAVGGRAGRVVASGRGGDVIVTGTMAANGIDPHSTGGTVTVNATGTVALGGQARVTASGQAGGGTIAIGTTPARAASGPTLTGQDTARSALMSRGAVIAADATRSGRGGIVTVLSRGVTRMEGTISARGVGHGGAVEVSGQRVSSASGQIDASASAGPHGTILIDPDFLDIVSGVAGGGSQDAFVVDGTIVAGDPSVPPDTISTGVLNGLTGDVLLQANQTISVKGDVTLTNTPTQSLVLEAGGTIIVDPGVRITTNGDVTLATGGAGPSSPPPGLASPLISVQGTIIANPGSITLLAGANGSITIGGSIIAASILLDAPAGIGVTGLASVGQFAGMITLRSQNGGVQQDNTARLVAGRLEAPEGIAGQVFLPGSNVVQSLGPYTVTGDGNSFILVNLVDLAIDGPLAVPHNVGIATTATERITLNGTISNATGALALIAGSGGIVLNSGARVPISRIGMTAANTISLAAGARLGTSGGLIDLTTSAGGVAQASGATITAGTLRSTRGITGNVLLQPGNTIEALGGMTIAAGGLALDSVSDLAVIGPVSASLGIALRSDARLTVFDSVRSATSVTLTAPGGIGLEAFAVLDAPAIGLSAGGPVDLAVGSRIGSVGAILDISTTAGAVTQNPDGTIIAASLIGSGGVAGDLSLTGRNTIASLGAIPVGGALLLHDAAGLTVVGTIAAAGGVYLRVSDDAGIVVAPGGGVVASGGGTAAFHAPRLRVGGTVVANAFEFAPEAPATPVTLGAPTSSIDSLLRVSATSATIGGVTVPGPGLSVTAGSMTVASAFDAGGLPLRLLSLGGIDAAAAPLQRVPILSGSAGGSVAVTHAATDIGALGPFRVSGVDADLHVATPAGLTVAGAIDATRDVVLGIEGNATLGAAIVAGRSLVVTVDGGITVTASAVAAPTLQLVSRGSIALGAGSALGQTGSLVDLTAGAGGVAQDATGRMIAARVISSGGITGDLGLIGTANSIGTVGVMAVTGGLDLVSLGSGRVVGPVTAAGHVSLRHAGGLTVDGTIAAGGPASVTAGLVTATGSARMTGAGVTLDGMAGVTLNAGSVIGVPGTPLVLRATAGAIVQDTAGTILADRLTVMAAGGITLPGIANRVVTLGSVSATSAGFLLVDAESIAIEGPVTAPGDVSVSAPGITVDGTVATGGQVSLMADAGGLAVTGAGTVTGTGIALRSNSPITLAAGAMIGQAGADIDLSTTAGGVIQDVDARLKGALRSSGGVTGDVLLLGTTNGVTALGDFPVTEGRFQLVDGSTELAIQGAVSASSIRIEAGSIAIGGTLAALETGVALLAAGSLSHAGLVRGTAVSIDAGAAIATSGTIDAGLDGLHLRAGTGLLQSGGYLASASGADLTAGGDLVQNAGTIVGGGPVTLTAGAGVTQSGTLRTTNGGQATLTGATITQGAGGLIEASAAGGVIQMTASQWIRTDGTLVARDAAVGTITLLARGTAADGFPLTVNGRVIAGFGFSGTAPLGSVSLGADIDAGAAGATISTASDLRLTSGTVTLPVAFGVTTPGSFIQQQGTLSATSLSITAQGGDIVQGSGAALLSADLQGRVDLLANGRIDMAGLVRANDPESGIVTLRAGGGLGTQAITQNGTILAGRTIALAATAGDIAHGGTAIADIVTITPVIGDWRQPSGLIRQRTTPFSVSTTGSASQGAAAALEAAGSITITADQGIDQAGTLSAPGGVISLLARSASLSATGAMTASEVRITNPAGQITIAGRIDGLAPARMQSESQYTIRAQDFPTMAERAGVFVTTAPGIDRQSIDVTADVAATTGRGQLLITIPNDAPLSLRTESRNADLFLALQRGPASGLVRVGSLHVRYEGKGTAGTVDLFGSVDGLSGFTATSASFILPSLLPNYQLNGCAIQSVSCFQISDLRVPVTNPLKDVQTGGGGSGGGSQSLLPDVAERDY